MDMDVEKKKYSIKKLNDRSYKNLQRIAKSKSLPSNVKKVHLIQLIYAKEYKSEKELNELINNVKLEKKLKSESKKSKQAKRAKKHDIQTPEVSSTSNKSPPITETPKPQKSILKQNSSGLNNTQPKNLRTYSANVRPATSDRVLRSSRERPNYRAINMGEVFDLVEPVSTPAKVNKKSGETNNTILNEPNDENLLTPVGNSEMREIRPETTSEVAGVNKRERKISGISPLVTPERFQSDTRTMSFTHKNGKVSRLKTYIERPAVLMNRSLIETSDSGLNTRCGADVIVRLVRGTVVQNQNKSRSIQFGNYQGTNENNNYIFDIAVERTQNLPLEVLPDPYNGCSVVNDTGNQMSQIRNIVSNSEIRQQVNSDFIRNDESNRRSLIYEQVSENSEKTQPQTYTPNESASNTVFLESLYNFKNQYITSSAPLQRITTTTNTTCVYSTPMVVTAILQQPPASVTNEYNACDMYVLGDQSNTTEYELVTDDEQNASPTNVYIFEEVDTSTSMETVSNEDILTNTPIPQVVEDAMDLISQDSEYMERVAMHMCMQCFFCPWAGSKFLHESHLRQEHIRDIETYETNEWVTTFTLGSLVHREVWLCHVLQHDSVFYVISAKYEDPDIFKASVNCITPNGNNITKLAKITVFNKVTGEPYTWEGLVMELPHTMPFYKDTECLIVELSKMNLLPNSANLKLVNRELVVDSPMKVVIGQPALHDIHINIFVKLSNITTL